MMEISILSGWGGRPSPHATEDANDIHAAIVGRDPDAAVALVDGFAGVERTWSTRWQRPPPKTTAWLRSWSPTS
jgi:hypothetical protein